MRSHPLTNNHVCVVPHRNFRAARGMHLTRIAMLHQLLSERFIPSIPTVRCGAAMRGRRMHVLLLASSPSLFPCFAILPSDAVSSSISPFTAAAEAAGKVSALQEQLAADEV